MKTYFVCAMAVVAGNPVFYSTTVEMDSLDLNALRENLRPYFHNVKADQIVIISLNNIQ